MGKSSGDAATRAQSETLAACDISAIKSEIMSNQKLAEEFHKSITKKREKRKVCSSFNIWDVDVQICNQ